MIDATDRRHLATAIELGRRALNQTSPNPHVGCLVVKEGQKLSAAYHERAGSPHAETLALAAAGDAARGSTLYVNLEPCCHQGRTPPCTRAILAAGVIRVVACHRDPNPLVNERGFQELSEHGVAVDRGALLEEAIDLNEPYLRSMIKGRPFGTLKAAQTLDGRIAAAGGESKWITSPWARDGARRLRDEVDAVAVGVRTVLSDDPDLRAGRQRRLRIIFDSKLRTPPAARLLDSAADHPVLIITTHAASSEAEELLRRRHAEVMRTEADGGGRVDLSRAIPALSARGIVSILYEGGGTLHASLVLAGLVDRALLFVAPAILGGPGGTPAVDRPTPVRLADALRIHRTRVRRAGEDLLVEADLYDRKELQIS